MAFWRVKWYEDSGDPRASYWWELNGVITAASGLLEKRGWVGRRHRSLIAMLNTSGLRVSQVSQQVVPMTVKYHADLLRCVDSVLQLIAEKTMTDESDDSYPGITPEHLEQITKNSQVDNENLFRLDALLSAQAQAPLKAKPHVIDGKIVGYNLDSAQYEELNAHGLLPCPFCGESPELPSGDGTQYEISCQGCGAACVSVQIRDLMTSEERCIAEFSAYRYADKYIDRAKEAAIKAWNTRKPPAGGVKSHD